MQPKIFRLYLETVKLLIEKMVKPKGRSALYRIRLLKGEGDYPAPDILAAMDYKILSHEPSVKIKYCFDFEGLYVDWTGDQTKESVMHGCELMLHFLKTEKCRKVLNDNSNVTSIWSEASEWVAQDWFPRMHAAGLDFFAWVYSPNIYSKLSTDRTLKYSTKTLVITFSSVSSAEEWLKAV